MSFSRIVLSFIPLTNYLFDIFVPTISPSELGVLAPIFDIFSPHNIVHCHRRLAAITTFVVILQPSQPTLHTIAIAIVRLFFSGPPPSERQPSFPA